MRRRCGPPRIDPAFAAGRHRLRDEPDSFAPGERLVAAAREAADVASHNLLHARLRSCVVVLASAFLVYLIQGAFTPTRRAVPIGYQATVGWALSLAAALLYAGGRSTVRRLRAIEVAVFGGLTIYVAADLFLAIRIGVLDPLVDDWRVAASLKANLAYVTALIFTYAIFIPNTWRRALAVCSMMAAAPVSAAAADYATLPEFRRLMAGDPAMAFENVGEHLFLLAASVGVSVFGVRTINEYRRELVRERELNRYHLGRKLGSGGMGEVYMAEHRLLKRPCAVKMIAPRLTERETSRARFELEVRATARLSHWNTVEIYDYGRAEDGSFYYVMEYLPGLCFQKIVDRHGPMPASRVIHLLRQVCEALREAHRAGLIHRDLKPPNIFAAYRGARYDVAKVLDFGLVKSVEDASPLLTLEGVVTGSPLYMAPELILKDRVPDGRVDVYSLGAVAYFLLTGRPPFLGSDAMAVMMAHAHEQAEPPSRHVADIPADLEAVVLRCLQKAPADRHADAEALSRALGACRDAGAWSDDMAEEWWRREPICPPPAGPDDAGEVLPSLSAAEFPGVPEPEPEQEPGSGEEPPDPLLTIGEPPAPGW